MKILAAVRDITFVKFCRKEWRIKRTTKKCFVYDPRYIVPKEKEDDTRTGNTTN